MVERDPVRYSETIAKRVLEAALPGATMTYRLTQSNGEYDFDLLYGDGKEAAVEVTAAVDETMARINGAIRNKRRGGSVIKAAVCRKSWMIFPARGASINYIRANADQQLRKLEQEGIDSFYCVSGPLSVRDVCSGLRVTGGGVISSETEPMILIASPIDGGAVGPSVAIAAGESEAWKYDNRAKLGSAKAVERHLVVYIGASNGLAWTALTSFAPPSALPTIPDEITNIWLIGHSETENEFVVWSAGTDEIWLSVKVVCAPETSSQENVLV